jgi:isopenicillin-N N-acyltransferase like protein
VSHAHQIQLLELSGSGRALGRQHGEALRSRIRDHLALREERMLAGASWTLAQFQDAVLCRTRFLAAARTHAPQLVEEVRGIAEGAGLSFERVFLAQLMDETGWLKAQWELDYRDLDESHCSTVAVNAPRPLLGQTVDMGEFADGWGVLIRHTAEDGRRMLRLTLPGVVGIYGLNDAGLGLCLNAMSGRMSRSENGLGTIFVARLLLECQTRAEAAALLRRIPHASGEVYTVGDGGGADCWEASPTLVARWAEGADRLAHTNHPLLNGDIWLTPERISALPAHVQDLIALGAENSAARLAALEAGLQRAGAAPDVPAIQAVLASHDSELHPVCRHPAGPVRPMTNFALVMELGAEPVLHLAGGPPCRHGFRAYRP